MKEIWEEDIEDVYYSDLTECVTVSFAKDSYFDKTRKYQPAIYQAQPRKSDGKILWKYVKHIGKKTPSFSSAMKQARSTGLRLLLNIRNNDPVG